MARWEKWTSTRFGNKKQENKKQTRGAWSETRALGWDAWISRGQFPQFVQQGFGQDDQTGRVAIILSYFVHIPSSWSCQQSTTSLANRHSYQLTVPGGTRVPWLTKQSAESQPLLPPDQGWSACGPRICRRETAWDPLTDEGRLFCLVQLNTNMGTFCNLGYPTSSSGVNCIQIWGPTNSMSGAASPVNQQEAGVLTKVDNFEQLILRSYDLFILYLSWHQTATVWCETACLSHIWLNFTFFIAALALLGTRSLWGKGNMFRVTCHIREKRPVSGILENLGGSKSTNFASQKWGIPMVLDGFGLRNYSMFHSKHLISTKAEANPSI